MLSSQLLLIVVDFGFDLSPEDFQLSHIEPLQNYKPTNLQTLQTVLQNYKRCKTISSSLNSIPRLRQKTKCFYEIN